MRDLDFEIDGAARHDRAALSILPAIETALADVPRERAGVRLHGIAALTEILTAGSIQSIAAASLGPDAFPVRAILFDKTRAANWTLGWHQDRTIVVRARHETPGFGPWTIKAGLHHVEPPFAIIARMVTLRIHLDAVPADNAPLLIVTGSHRLGRITERDVPGVVERLDIATCIAERGDVWAYATPILHASGATSTIGHRRVLQVDYASGALPTPLEWNSDAIMP